MPGAIIGKIAGGLIGGILGKKSGNKQAEQLRLSGAQAGSLFAPFTGVGGQANNAIAGALGQNGQPAQDAQFQNFLGSTGFKSQLQAGSQAITGNNAASGLLNSGATLKGLNTFGQGLAQRGFNNFLGNLGGLANRGLSAAQGSANAQIGTSTAAAAAQAGGSNALSSGLGQAFGAVTRGIFG